MTLLLNEIVLLQFCFTFILEYMQFSKNIREEKWTQPKKSFLSVAVSSCSLKIKQNI